MRSRRFLRLRPTLYLPALLLVVTAETHAVTQFVDKRRPFVFDINNVNGSISLPVLDKIETIKMDEKHLISRINQSNDNQNVEPLTLTIKTDESSINNLSERLAVDDQAEKLADFFRQSISSEQINQSDPQTKSVVITKDAFEKINPNEFAQLYSKTHHNLTIPTDELRANRKLRRELMKQLSPFLKKSERQVLGSKIAKGEPLHLDQDLLPDFPKRMVRKYIIFRGPNCFHAALAFHSPQMTSSSLINVKQETGYHRAMINYDELWRALNRNFYEIDPEKMPLKYGDMLVFFDVPKDQADDLEKPVDFRWIRHTATYLLSGYTFSKGSKSPNTPYSVRTVGEEWKTWKQYTKNLGLKVFRRSHQTVKLHPPVDLVDWIY